MQPGVLGKRGDGHEQLVAVPLVRDVLLEMLRKKENHVTAASQCKKKEKEKGGARKFVVPSGALA
jgi:hypothetical protein